MLILFRRVSESDLVSFGTLAVIDDGRLTFFGKECSATIHTMPCCRRRENSGLPFPMHHILACYMRKRVPSVLIDIMKMIKTVIIDGTVWVCG